MLQTPFLKGIELSEVFYREQVRPILDAHFPDLNHAAGRLGAGSDVLGFDTPQSRDHHWGPRVTLFVEEAAYPQRGEVIHTLSQELPTECCGYPTNFDDPESGEAQMVPTEGSPIRHGVKVTTAARFFTEYVGFDPTARSIDYGDWLAVPAQRLATIERGAIFHDGLDTLETARERLRWYPHDVWLYLLACQWRKIDQEEPFMARAGDAGSELGSELIAARQVIELMRLCFLMERQYPPYTKWLGTAFELLTYAGALSPVFHKVIHSKLWKTREKALSDAYMRVMDMHNALDITPTVPAEITPFHNRPYRVPHAGRFADALYHEICIPEVKAWPEDVGAVWQFADSTDVLDNVGRCRALVQAIFPEG